jgi:tRNA(fMet)-specific endonuclease VapC
MKYYLDTNICIYFLKGMYPILLKKLMSKNPEDIKIAAMVKAELIYGAEKSKKCEENIEKIKCFLLPFEVISFDENAAVYYAKIRSVLEKTGGIIGPNDLIIAATVMSNKGTLITNNEKEFNRIDELEIENWIK